MFAIVDLETTGGSSRWGRITEIAIFIHDGREVVDSFSSLLNPGMPIPSFITQLTGISDEMVADAPSFSDLAASIQSLTEGCIFVAHNASFDYHFLKQEFLRLGQSYERPNLCTVRLSRKFIPGHASYSLGRLCEALEIPLEGRHRAGGDAAATVKLFDRILQSVPEAEWLPYVSPAEGQPSPLNRYLQSLTLEDIPTTPGLLYFLNEQEEVIYLEAARHLKKRTKAILSNKGGRRLLNMRDQVKDLRYEETGNLLIAELRAIEEMQAIQPAFNKVPKNPQPPTAWTLSLEEDIRGYLQLKAEKAQCWPAPFSSRKKAQEAIARLKETFFLKDTLPEPLREREGYNERAQAALASLPTNPPEAIRILRGRCPGEFCVLTPAGLSLRYGYISGEAGFNQEDLIEACNEKLNHPQAVPLLHKHLPRERVIRSILLSSDGTEEKSLSRV